MMKVVCFCVSGLVFMWQLCFRILTMCAEDWCAEDYCAVSRTEADVS